MVPSPSLDEALQHYDRALTDLEKAKGDRSVLPSLILNLLTQRDAVQLVVDDIKVIPAEQVVFLGKLDDRLKKQKNAIATTNQLGRWRSLLHSPETAWWWYPEPPALFPLLEKRFDWLDRLDWLWTFISLFALTLSFTVVLDTLNRVVGEGLSTSGMFPVVVQVVLTIAGGATALTSNGRQLLESGMGRLRIPRHFWQEFSAIVSIVVLLMVIGINDLYLPRVAVERYEDGIVYHDAQQFDSALQAYQQAIALKPDFVQAHYSLGLLYEDLQRTDDAIAEYQLVMSSDPDSLNTLFWLRAHNNLGRLYILQDDYQAAWTPLKRSFDSLTGDDLANPEIQVEKYNLLKNLGWMWLEQKQFVEADEFLQQAIAQNSQRAAAHCLQAQALEGLKRSNEAKRSWDLCIGGERTVQPEEAVWAAMARETLAGGTP